MQKKVVRVTVRATRKNHGRRKSPRSPRANQVERATPTAGDALTQSLDGLSEALPVGLISLTSSGESAAAAEVVRQAPDGGTGFTVLFCSTQYELKRLGKALNTLGRERVVAAVASRVFGRNGFLADGMTGFHLPADRFRVASRLIEDVSQFAVPQAREIVRSLRARLQAQGAAGFPHLFGILLVDAEPRCEERVVAALAIELAGIPLVGGSAGDFYFNPGGHSTNEARILHHGKAVRGGAVFCLVASERQVLAVSHHHFTPGRRQLVITDADPERRLVREINGKNAVREYAAACGLSRRPVDAAALAPYPLMIRIAGQYFARGVQRVYQDGSIEFACAMEPGLVVTIAQPGDMIGQLRQTFDTMRAAIGPPALVIGFDCAARTVYMEQQGLSSAVATVFESNSVVGFSTLGEQFNTIHANNSFTCLGVAAAK